MMTMGSVAPDPLSLLRAPTDKFGFVLGDPGVCGATYALNIVSGMSDVYPVEGLGTYGGSVSNKRA